MGCSGQLKLAADTWRGVAREARRRRQAVRNAGAQRAEARSDPVGRDRNAEPIRSITYSKRTCLDQSKAPAEPKERTRDAVAGVRGEQRELAVGIKHEAPEARAGRRRGADVGVARVRGVVREQQPDASQAVNEQVGWYVP